MCHLRVFTHKLQKLLLSHYLPTSMVYGKKSPNIKIWLKKAP